MNCADDGAEPLDPSFPFLSYQAAGVKTKSSVLQKKMTQRFRELPCFIRDLHFGGGQNGLSTVIKVLWDLLGRCAN